MKTLHKKILIFVVILTVVLSTFCVSAFAISYDPYVFSETLDEDSLSNISGTYTDFVFTSGGLTYRGFYVTYRGYWALEYLYYDQEGSVLAYSSDSGWSAEHFRTLYFSSTPGDNDVINFLTVNEYIEPVGYSGSWYNHIYTIISSTLFGESFVPPEASLAISLVSVILSLCAVLLPVLICVFIFVWILKRV